MQPRVRVSFLKLNCFSNFKLLDVTTHSAAQTSLQDDFSHLPISDDVTSQFIFANTSIIRAEDIMIFSDQQIQFFGSLENTYETQEGNMQVINSCIPSKIF